MLVKAAMHGTKGVNVDASVGVDTLSYRIMVTVHVKGGVVSTVLSADAARELADHLVQHADYLDRGLTGSRVRTGVIESTEEQTE